MSGPNGGHRTTPEKRCGVDLPPYVHPVTGLQCRRDAGHEGLHELDVHEAAEWFNEGDTDEKLFRLIAGPGEKT